MQDALCALHSPKIRALPRPDISYPQAPQGFAISDTVSPLFLPERPRLFPSSETQRSGLQTYAPLPAFGVSFECRSFVGFGLPNAPTPDSNQ